MQASMQHRVLADAIFPDLGSQTKIGCYIRDAVLVLGFTLLMTLCAQIVIKLPGTVVPITGQTFGALLAGGALGSKRGPISMFLYMLIGMLGVGVFAASGSDIKEFGSLHVIFPWAGTSGVIFSMASGGYIVGFIFASFLIGKLAERGWDRKSKVILSMLLGNIVIYVFGLPWLMINLSASLENTLLWGLWPFIPGDAVKLVLASLALPGAWALVDKIKK
ncbi:MAG: biotin transporter BioY [Gammaproteobacteria bacterium]|nr:biotin transporter BioY [Gammaproteobacteria bacterium]